MANLSKEDVKNIIVNAPTGVDRGKLIDDLVARGHVLEGYNDAKDAVSDNQTSQLQEQPFPPGITSSFLSGVVGQEKQSGVTFPNIAETVGQNIGPMVGGTLGAAAGPAGIGAGAAAGRAIQDVVQNVASVSGADATIKSPAEIVGGTLEEGLLNWVGAKMLPSIAKKVKDIAASAIKGAGELTAKTIGKSITGLPYESLSRLIERPSEVFNKIAMDPETGPNLAKAFKLSIAENMKLADIAYKDNIQAIINNNTKYGPNFRLNISDMMQDAINTVRKDYGYGVSGPLGKLADKTELDIFNKFADAAKSLNSATSEDIYYFQRYMNHAIRNNEGKPIASALGKLKSEYMSRINTVLPEIGQANAIYKSAMDLDEEVSKVLNADDAANVIRRAFKTKGDLRDALNHAADNVSGVRQQLEGILDAVAGKSFKPWVRDMPATGFTAGIGALGLGAYSGMPAAKMVGAAVLPALSPRLVGSVISAGSRLSQAISKPLSESLTRLGRPAIPLTMAIVKENLGLKFNTIQTYGNEIERAIEKAEMDKADKLQEKLDKMVSRALNKQRR